MKKKETGAVLRRGGNKGLRDQFPECKFEIIALFIRVEPDTAAVGVHDHFAEKQAKPL